MTSTLTLTEFLLARIAEDEDSVSAYFAGRPPVETGLEDADPARVLADCKAKRRIVERATCDDAPDCGDHDCRVIDEDRHILASVYADHPQFQKEEWRA